MILVILVGNYLGNMPVKFESHWPDIQQEQIVDDRRPRRTLTNHNSSP